MLSECGRGREQGQRDKREERSHRGSRAEGGDGGDRGLEVPQQYARPARPAALRRGVPGPKFDWYVDPEGPVDSEILIVLVLLATVVLRFAMAAGLAYLLVPRGPACPICRADLLRITHGVASRLFPVLQHAWCLDCGWEGVVRRSPGGDQPRRALIEEVIPRPVE